ncbi:ribosome maturation factor RimP [Naumannella sp. ID2617S]|uniref:Ribosome maturation factor RimP n=1 Tax=Enemella dayhoffiae TaxID=2016507 RepID=A0A255H6B9_9ACTN|nr:ribosome maturation factor RimP [Enemella dayhoffiae]NNG18733.1 ribosome maturation factor RimP [Naumannella sp. ID2617S]OYO23069.1 ribosome maturation factor RimP [Enemella dayhoffiae]
MKESQLVALLTPILAQHGLELDALDSVPAGKRRLLRVTVDGDGPAGRGPTLDDISEATRDISAALDESDAVGPSAYTLEVSSRGVGRPLTEPRHWRRNTGRLVRITPHEGEPVTGRITSSDDDGVTLTVVTDPKKQTTEDQTWAYADLAKALIQVELNRKNESDDEEGDE